MKKDIKGKLRLNLIPHHGLEAVARVREFGNSKYLDTGHDYIDQLHVDELVEACSRHILKHNKGELLDPESSLMHLAHVASSAMMAIEIIHRDMEVDNLSLRTMQSLFKGIAEIKLRRVTEYKSESLTE